jgi:hypothetical protein
MTASSKLLSLLSGEPAEFAEVVTGRQAADVAEALQDPAPRPPAACSRLSRSTSP